MTKLKQIRSEKGLTQKTLSDLTGISLRTIQHYEQGDKDINKAAVIVVYNLSKALKCNIVDLIDIEKGVD